MIQVLLPRPHPDESLTSIIARHAAHLSLPNTGALNEALFGTEAMPSVDLPKNLDRFARSTRAGLGKSGLDCVRHLTLASYLGHALAPERRGALLSAMLGDGSGNLQNRFGLSSSNVSSPTSLRFCPACVAEQRSRYGECYWRRSHQLPGCDACADHGWLLIGSEAPYRSAGLRCYHDAERVVPRSGPRIEADQHVVAISRICVETLVEGSRLFPNLPVHCEDRHRVIGKEAGALLGRDFIAVHGSPTLRQIGLSFDPEDGGNWLIRALRHPGARVHPLQRILARHFASDREDLSQVQQRRAVRPHRVRLVPEADVPDLRLRWEQALDSTPNRSRAIAARSCQLVYDRLAAVDRSWLFSEPRRYNRAPGNERHVEWDRRDRTAAAALAEAATRIRAAMPARRVTRSAMVLEAGLGRGLLSQFARLPLCKVAVSDMLEDLDSYHVRLLRLSARELNRAGMASSITALRLRSKLTGPLGPRARACLRQLGASGMN